MLTLTVPVFGAGIGNGVATRAGTGVRASIGTGGGGGIRAGGGGASGIGGGSGMGGAAPSVPPPRAGERAFLGVAGADIRMARLEPELLAILRAVPVPAVLVTAERRVVAANTPRWIAGTRLGRLPAAGDGTFGAVSAVGADSGWLPAAAG